MSHMVAEMGWIWLSENKTFKKTQLLRKHMDQSEVLVTESNVQMSKREKHF